MAGSGKPFTPPFDNILKIIRYVKKLYKWDPGAETHHMIRQVHFRLHNRVTANEIQFTEFVLGMINTYLDTVRKIQHPDRFNDPGNEQAKYDCPYFIEINNALQFSHYYRSRVMCLCPQPITTSGTRFTSSEVDVVTLETTSNWSGHDEPSTFYMSLAEALGSTLALPYRTKLATKQCNGRKVGLLEYKMNIAAFMKECYNNNPHAKMDDTAKAIHKLLNPDEDLDSFLKCITSIINAYHALRRTSAHPDINPFCSELLISSCPYYDDIHEALKRSMDYRYFDWTSMGKVSSTPHLIHNT